MWEVIFVETVMFTEITKPDLAQGIVVRTVQKPDGNKIVNVLVARGLVLLVLLPR